MEETHDVDQLATLAVDTLKAYFEDTEPDKRDEVRAKIAASVFSTAVRLKQTQGARDALAWGMATILLDKEALREYVRVSMPESALVKALPESAGKVNST